MVMSVGELVEMGTMNSTASIWAGAGLVVVALLIVAYVQGGMFGIACVFGISIILIGVGLIANGLKENYCPQPNASHA